MKNLNTAKNTTFNDKVSILASGYSIENQLVEKLINEIGFNKTKAVLIISKEFDISIDLAKNLNENPQIIRALKMHPVLIEYLKLSPEEILINLGKRDIKYKISNIQSGHLSHGNMKSYLRFVDLHTCTFPTIEDKEKYEELILLDEFSKGESLKNDRKGAIGHIDFTLGECEGAVVQFVLNGQARMSLWHLSNRLKNQYKKWYERSLESMTTTGEKVGVKALLIPSGNMIKDGIMQGWGHYVPDGIIKQFYDRYAEKREFILEKLKVTHPVTKASVTGKVWTKEL